MANQEDEDGDGCCFTAASMDLLREVKSRFRPNIRLCWQRWPSGWKRQLRQLLVLQRRSRWSGWK